MSYSIYLFSSTPQFPCVVGVCWLSVQQAWHSFGFWKYLVTFLVIWTTFGIRNIHLYSYLKSIIRRVCLIQFFLMECILMLFGEVYITYNSWTQFPFDGSFWELDFRSIFSMGSIKVKVSAAVLVCLVKITFKFYISRISHVYTYLHRPAFTKYTQSN